MALTVLHFSLLCTVEYTIHNKAFNLAWHLCVQDVQPRFTTTKVLHYIYVYLKISKIDPFSTGDTGDYRLLWHSGLWVLCDLGLAPMPPHQQLSSQCSFFPDSWCPTHQGHHGQWHQVPPYKAGPHPDIFTGHSMRIGGVTTTTAAGLANWESNFWGGGEAAPTSHTSGRLQICGPTCLRGLPPSHPPVLSTISGPTQWRKITQRSTSSIRGENIVVRVNSVPSHPSRSEYSLVQFWDLPQLRDTFHRQLVPPRLSDTNTSNHTPVAYPQTCTSLCKVMVVLKGFIHPLFM